VENLFIMTVDNQSILGHARRLRVSMLIWSVKLGALVFATYHWRIDGVRKLIFRSGRMCFEFDTRPDLARAGRSIRDECTTYLVKVRVI
jgi:hypothetical protein